MSVIYSYDEQKKAIYGEMIGELIQEEIRAVIEKISFSKMHSPNVKTLWDMRGLDFSNTDSYLVNHLINIRKHFTDRHIARLAFVVKDDLGFGMTRMYDILSYKMDDVIGVFRDYSEAEEWLLREPKRLPR